MADPTIVDRDTWLIARQNLLAAEKQFTRERDRLNASRRALPAVLVDKPYRFSTERGEQTLTGLFGDNSQLLIYHFMFGKTWQEGCPSCSFWADSFNGSSVHLAARDTAFFCVSSAPLTRLLAYRARMGWQFDWASSGDSDFNADFGVTFAGNEPGPTNGYNYGSGGFGEEMPGISAFSRLADGSVVHTYSAYSRGLDMINGTYHLLDLTASGRDEAALPFTQAWVRRHDQYD